MRLESSSAVISTTMRSNFHTRFYYNTIISLFLFFLSNSDSLLRKLSQPIVVKAASHFAVGKVEMAKTISDIDISHISASAVARKKVYAVLLPRMW